MPFLTPLALAGLLFIPVVIAMYLLKLRRDEAVELVEDRGALEAGVREDGDPVPAGKPVVEHRERLRVVLEHVERPGDDDGEFRRLRNRSR